MNLTTRVAMKRKLCHNCQRPENACICPFIQPVANDILVVVFQHPSEVTQTKGTVTLLSKSLLHCQVIVGENVNDNEALIKIIQQYQVLLLYPSAQAQVLKNDFVEHYKPLKNSNKPLCLLILDGTWKKSYRMYMVSTILHQLPQVCLPQKYAQAGQYSLRKVNKENALSSLEACCYALNLLEQNEKGVKLSEKYQKLLNNFVLFNDFQLSFSPR